MITPGIKTFCLRRRVLQWVFSILFIAFVSVGWALLPLLFDDVYGTPGFFYGVLVWAIGSWGLFKLGEVWP